MNKKLILFENDLNLSTLKSVINQYQNVFLVLLSEKDRQIRISKTVFEFKNSLLNEFASKFKNIKIIESSKLNEKVKNLKNLDVLYPGIGDNLDYLKRFQVKKNLEINYLVRKQDLYSWKYAKKGFLILKRIFQK
tara:strand:- start:7674 stop:8078 length:405 start_codon:yes stop_codon:yes gene_type:complete